ncbi:hypothetical protein BGZ70_005860 [Mortierella alpina]|uniref:Uncharacterized protein n=1 Tax=Mortierella alpina TaxID=64518 RepID=A0A9P6M4A0_MORAP|nr:hypothetical protein BGZ70_005860 [Mortierella alpina]
MFLPWSFFQMYIFFFFFQVLLSSALGAVLALYSKASQGYAHSIRWVRQGGHLEMLSAIGYFSWKLPGTVFGILFAMVLLDVLISLTGTGAQILVKQAIRQTSAAQQIIQIAPFIATDHAATIQGWATTVSPGGSIVNALAMTINNTRNIPDAQTGRQYIPRLYPYESACDRLNFIAVHPNNTHLQISSNGCANLSIVFDNLFEPNVSRSYVTRRSDNRGTIILPGRYDTDGTSIFLVSGAYSAEMASYVLISPRAGQKCLTGEFYRNMIVPAQSGVTNSPTTVVTKCLYATGEIITLSSTSVRFSVPKLKSFRNVTSSIFDQQDDLLVGMERSISEGRFSHLAADVSDAMQVMEVKTIGTEVHILACAARRASPKGTIYLMCSYTTAAATLTKPQSMLPEFFARRAGKPYAPYARYALYTVDILAEHLPLANSVGSGQPRYATASILAASREAATYFASLGQNFYIDWTERKILLIFETIDPLKGYEIPLWLFATVIAAMVGSLALVLTVEFSMEDKFKRSLQWMVSEELASSQGQKAPMLMEY